MAHIEQLVDNETMEMYVSMFDSHLENTRRLVTGLDDEQEGDTTPAPSEDSLSLSLFPSAYWSPAEKGAFFHALSIYSRHRPELIATTIRHAIPSSSVSTLQVTNMLALLRKASLSTILRGRKRKRDEIEAARIMTKEWAHFEEECADMLLMGEAAGRRDSLIQRRTEQLIKPQSSSPLPNDHDAVPQVNFDLVRPDALVQNHILHHRKRKRGEDDNHDVECDSHFAHSDVDRAAPTMGDSRPKRRRLLDLTPLHRKWIREDIFATLSITRSKALKTLLHPKSEPPSAKLAPLLELATEAGLTKDSEELKDVDLLDIKKLRNVTKHLRFLTMDPKSKHRAKDHTTTLLPSLKPSYEPDGSECFSASTEPALELETARLLASHIRAYVERVIKKTIVLTGLHEATIGEDDETGQRKNAALLHSAVLKAIQLTSTTTTLADRITHRNAIGERLGINLNAVSGDWIDESDLEDDVGVDGVDRPELARGSDKEMDIDVDDGAEVQLSSSPSPAKKKRGRPRKHPVPTAEELAKPKRGRGRPRKVQPPPSAVGDTEASQPKDIPVFMRPRGRPRKQERDHADGVSTHSESGTDAGTGSRARLAPLARSGSAPHHQIPRTPREREDDAAWPTARVLLSSSGSDSDSGSDEDDGSPRFISESEAESESGTSPASSPSHSRRHSDPDSVSESARVEGSAGGDYDSDDDEEDRAFLDADREDDREYEALLWAQFGRDGVPYLIEDSEPEDEDEDDDEEQSSEEEDGDDDDIDIDIDIEGLEAVDGPNFGGGAEELGESSGDDPEEWDDRKYVPV